jgi:hypothetical protein
MPAGNEQTAYYSRPARRVFGVTLGLLGVAWAGLATWGWTSSPASGALFAVCGIVALGWMALALLRMGVYVHDDHLRIRTNLGRIRRVPWSAVAGFEIGEARDRFSSYRVGYARLRDGDLVRLDGTTSSGIDPGNGERCLAGLTAQLSSKGRS